MRTPPSSKLSMVKLVVPSVLSRIVPLPALAGAAPLKPCTEQRASDDGLGSVW